MSSLQKFHRRTNGSSAISPFPTIGSGSTTIGYWLGTAGDGTSKLIVAPQSTEGGNITWGSKSTIRYTQDINDGLPNTNTLAGFGSTAHPAAYQCKNLTTGGYNTWYMPAKNELMTMYSNKGKAATQFNVSGTGYYYWSSTEETRAQYSANSAWTQCLGPGTVNSWGKTGGYGITYLVRAVRKTLV